MATIKLPPPKAKTGHSERSYFDQFVAAHAPLKPYASLIWTWANNYGGITPTQLAAIIWFESKGNPTALSNKGALGIAQIYDTSANPTNQAGVPFFRTDRTITDRDKRNPAFAIQYMAWRLSGYATAHGGNIDQVYVAGYNPGYTGAAPISTLLPKGYIPVAGRSIDQSASRSAAQSQVTGSLTDPWVVLGKNGQITTVKTAEAPGNALTYGGQPLTLTQYTSIWKQTYRDTFMAYTGRDATGKEIQQILASGVTPYALQNRLAQLPGFAHSPIYKSRAPGYLADARAIMGGGWKPPAGFIRDALAGNLDQASFEAKLRAMPAYEHGPEFKTNLAQNTSAYTGIFGNPDPTVKQFLADRTKAGWTPTELQAWLMQQPAYQHSAEYQSRQLNFASALGLVTGAAPTLSDDQLQQLLASGDTLGGVPTTAGGAQFTGASFHTGGVFPGRTTSGLGEPKNEPPFTRQVTP